MFGLFEYLSFRGDEFCSKPAVHPVFLRAGYHQQRRTAGTLLKKAVDIFSYLKRLDNKDRLPGKIYNL
jgi:hypothetical protein